jgi:arylsulfatase A-like enzyme
LLTSLSPSAHGVTRSFAQLDRDLRRGEFERLADEHETLAEALARHGYATAAFTGGATMDPRIGFDQGFASYDTSMAKLSEAGLGALLAFVAARREAPFFLFWHSFEVHAPYLDTRFASQVLATERSMHLAEALAGLAAGKGVSQAADAQRALLKREGLFTRRVCAALYDGGVASVDRWIGALLDDLRRRGLYQRALIVLTSDHGEQLGERDGRFFNTHGHNLHEEMLRVPLIVKLPGQRHAGRRVAAVTRAIDVMPTILDLLDLPAVPRLQGASLRPLLSGGAEPARQAFSEALAFEDEAKSLRGERYKFALRVGAEHVARHGRAAVPEQLAARELYDLEADPGETENLLEAPDPERERLAARLEVELRRLAAERVGQAARTQLDPEALEAIRALGYAQ